jgi:GNAT superfamily N-acetyltransferase
MALIVKQVTNTAELEGILVLQRQNLKAHLSGQDIDEQGFVTVEHTLLQLHTMHQACPSLIAIDADSGALAGYALVMLRGCADAVPMLQPAFAAISQLVYNNRVIDQCSWYLMGQICVAKAFRGQGVFRQLYLAHRNYLNHQYDYCITTISQRNTRSIMAHERMGFRCIHEFEDPADSWRVVLWDWTEQQIIA